MAPKAEALTAIVSGDDAAWVSIGMLFTGMGRLEEATHVLEQAAADGDPLAQEVLPDVRAVAEPLRPVSCSGHLVDER